jgi:hypothetical protein
MHIHVDTGFYFRVESLGNISVRRDGSGSILTIVTGQTRFDSLQGHGFLLATTCTAVLQFIRFPIQQIAGTFLHGGKRPERKSDHSSPVCADDMNTSTPACVKGVVMKYLYGALATKSCTTMPISFTMSVCLRPFVHM